MMDFCKVPMGFGMALSMNPTAMNAYFSMTEEEKRAVLNRANNACSKQEMADIANGLAKHQVQ